VPRSAIDSQTMSVADQRGAPTGALGFVARWCVPGDPPGLYRGRDDEPGAKGAEPVQVAALATALPREPVNDQAL